MRIAEQKEVVSSEESAGTDPVEDTEQPAAPSPTEGQDVKGISRFDPTGKDLNSYTSGRINIWNNYAKFFNMTGNNADEMDWAVLTNNTVKHAHNNFIEIAYRCGVPVAILHTLINLFAGLISLIVLFDRKYRRPCYLFSVIFVMMYTVEGLFDIATIPFERHAPFFFYLALIPLISLSKEKKNSDNSEMNEREKPRKVYKA